MSKVICSCKNVTKKDIKKSIENGAISFKEVKQETHLGKGCGKCKKKAKKIVTKALKKMKSK